MKTIQMSIDEALLQDIDTLIQSLNVSRSAFIRELLRDALHQHKIEQLEAQHRRGYEQQPQDDLSDWMRQQVWEDDGEDWSQFYAAG